MSEKHPVRNWRGSRASYNFLKINNAIDPWTKYFVVDRYKNKDTITEYFGLNVINIPSGEFMAVNDVLETPPLSVNPYDRFLIGNDNDGYEIYEYTPIKDSDSLHCNVIDFDWRHGVRILSRNLKCYVYYNGHLVTYDDVDCGEF